jgi:hypothetical protein
MSKSNVASTLARLRNRARATGYPVESMLLLHLCERFLARVAASAPILLVHYINPRPRQNYNSI